MSPINLIHTIVDCWALIFVVFQESVIEKNILHGKSYIYENLILKKKMFDKCSITLRRNLYLQVKHCRESQGENIKNKTWTEMPGTKHCLTKCYSWTFPIQHLFTSDRQAW